VHVNRLKPYHSQVKHNVEFPDQAWTTDDVSPPIETARPKRSYRTKPVTTRAENDEIRDDFENFFQPPVPMKTIYEPLQQPIVPPTVQLPPPMPSRPRGRPKKTFAEVVKDNPSPVSRHPSVVQTDIQTPSGVQPSRTPSTRHSRASSFFSPGSDLISSRTRSKAVAPTHLPLGGSEGLSSDNTTPTLVDAAAAAFAAGALTTPTATTANISDNNEDNDWVLVLRKQRKRAVKDQIRQNQDKCFRQTGDTYQFGDYKNGVTIEFDDIPSAAGAPAPAPIQLFQQALAQAQAQVQAQAQAQPVVQGVPAQAQTQPNQAQAQNQIPAADGGALGHQAGTSGATPAASTGPGHFPTQDQAQAGAHGHTGRVDPDDRPIRPVALRNDPDDRPIRPAALHGDPDDRLSHRPQGTRPVQDLKPQPSAGARPKIPSLPAQPQSRQQRGRVGGDPTVPKRNQPSTEPKQQQQQQHHRPGQQQQQQHTQQQPRPQQPQPAHQPQRVLRSHLDPDEQSWSADRPTPRTQPRSGGTTGLDQIPEEDDLLGDITPPEFFYSPSTPRSNPRYDFRPSPSPPPPPPPHDDPFHASQLRKTLDDAFRETEEALFGPRLTRSRKPHVDDDVLHRYPSERGKRGKK